MAIKDTRDCEQEGSRVPQILEKTPKGIQRCYNIGAEVGMNYNQCDRKDKCPRKTFIKGFWLGWNYKTYDQIDTNDECLVGGYEVGRF